MPSSLVQFAPPCFTAAFLFALSLADGGFFAWTWPWATLALAAAAVGVSLIQGGVRAAPLDAAFVAGLVAVAGWQALSSEWSLDPGRSLQDAFRGTVYVAAAASFVVLARAAAPAGVLLGVVGGGAATLLYGILQRARSGTADPLQQGLLFQPIGYANAVGIMAAVVALLALGLLAESRSFAARAVLGGVVAVSSAALVLTNSRGAWLAGGAGLVTTGILRWPGRPRWAWVGWLVFVGLGIVSILVSPLLVAPGRLASVMSDRPYYWSLAWHSLASPLHGLGSGAFAQLWAVDRPIPHYAIDAHSLYLEALLELGAVGLLVVVATLAVPLVVAGRLIRGSSAAAAGAYTAFLVHAAVDWDWEMPVVTIVGLASGVSVLAAAAAARGPRI